MKASYKTTEGFLMKVYTSQERNEMLKIINTTDVSLIGKTLTTGTGKKYIIVDEIESGEDLKITISANNKKSIINCNIYNQHEKIRKCVTKMYNN